MVKQIGNPELLDAWASEGDISEPFESKQKQGWLYQEQPSSAHMNWVQNIQQQKINHLLKNGVSEWSAVTDYTQGAIVKYANTAWKALRDNTTSEPGIGNKDWDEIKSLDIIRAPDLISPINGVSSTPVGPTLTASAYAPVYSVDTRDYREFQVAGPSSDFSAPIVMKQVNANNWTVTPNLASNGGFVWRCRDVSVRGDKSPWSIEEGFTTGTITLNQPAITSPANNATGIGRAPVFTSGAFSVSGGSDTHAASFWRVFQGDTQVWSSGRTTSAKTSITLPSNILIDGETVYTVQVRHEGTLLGVSEWSVASTFTTINQFMAVVAPAITAPANNETEVGESPTLRSGAFSVVNGSDTHAASFWEIVTAADVAVWSSGRSTSSRTSIVVPDGVLQDGETAYKVRVRHEGKNLGVSPWSVYSNFTTALNFARVFSGGADDVLRKIKANGMAAAGTFTGHTGDILAVAFGSDGYVYTAGADGTVRKTDPATMTQAGSFSGHTGAVNAVIYSVDGFVYSGGADGTVRKISKSAMTQAGSFSGHTGAVMALAAGDAGFVYSGGVDDIIHKIETSGMTSSDNFAGNTDDVVSLSVGSDGFVYSGSKDAKLRKVDPSTMTQSGVFDGTSTSYAWDTVQIQVGFISYEHNGTVNLNQMGSHSYTELGKFLPLNSTDQNGKSITYIKKSAGAGTTSPPSNGAPISGVYRAVSGKTVGPKTTAPPRYQVGWGEAGSWTPGDDGRHYDVNNVQKRTTLFSTTGAFNALAFGSDGFLYLGIEDGSIRKIDPVTMTVATTYSGSNAILALAAGGDGFLYSGGADKAVRKINPADMTQSGGSFTAHTGVVNGVAYNYSIPDLLGFS